MKDLHFDGAEPNWVKWEVLDGDGKKKPEDIESLQKEIERLRQINWDLAAEFEKSKQVL